VNGSITSICTPKTTSQINIKYTSCADLFFFIAAANHEDDEWWRRRIAVAHSEQKLVTAENELVSSFTTAQMLNTWGDRSFGRQSFQAITVLTNDNKKTELSHNMTARFALYMRALKIFGSPWLCPWLLFPTMPAPQSGTRCLMNLEILTLLIVLNGSWKQFSLAATSVSSASEVIFIMWCAI